MNLENRVEVLEHELKILKNEIEGTLLEIQNQVLIHYYPELRAEDSAPPQEALKTPVARAKAKDAIAEDATPPLVPWSNGMANMQMKEISLSDFADDPPPLPKQEAATEAQLGPVALAQLAKWVDDAIAQVGKAQTTAVVEAYADASTDTIQAALRQFITLSVEEVEPAAVDTTALMQVSRKLNKVFDQVAKLVPQTDDRYKADRYTAE